MELPKCPSCGQSVLDDDATDCPFCGAAMDGSAASKKPVKSGGSPARVPQPAPAKTAAAAADADPFAIAQNPAAVKAIQCARKPMKGRLHRVVCPMCDTQGFLPKSAIGKSVKCANRECLVPVFTAPGSDDEPQVRAPVRVSDQETAARQKTSSAAGSRNPIIMYSVVGSVLLALTLGLVWYLNQEGVQQLGPVVIPDSGQNGADPDGDENDGTAGNQDPEGSQQVNHRDQTLKLVDLMIQSARVNTGNRDKAFCRRLTADVYLQLGMDAEAEAEFEQMKVVSARTRQKTDYYMIGPLVAQYWARGRSDSESGRKMLTDAVALIDQMPTAVGLAQESAVELAAAMADSGDADRALALITAQQRDSSITSHQDGVRYGAWLASATALWDADTESLPPLEVFSWHEPLITAVAVRLATERRWSEAAAWATAQSDSRTAGDTFAVVAGQMTKLQAPAADRQALAAAAETKGQTIGLRVASVLAQADDADVWWKKAQAAYASLPDIQALALPSMAQVIELESPDLGNSQLTGEALTDFVVAAVKRGDTATATEALGRLQNVIMSGVPPTAVVRRAAGEIDSNDDRVKERIAAEIGLSNPNQIRTRFIAYRKSIDQLARAAEERRWHLLEMLARMVRGGALDVVRAAAKDPENPLRQELDVDGLGSVLFAAAARAGFDYPEILTPDPALAVVPGRVARSEPLDQQSVIPDLVAAWQQYQKSPGIAAVKKMEAAIALPGLRSAMAISMTERAARQTDSVRTLLAAIQEIRNELWRERCLAVATRVLASRGLSEQITKSLETVTLTPTQRVIALHAVACAAIRKAVPAETDDSVQPKSAAAMIRRSMGQFAAAWPEM